MPTKSPEKLISIRLHDYVNNPKDPVKVKKDIPKLEDKPEFITDYMWGSIVNIILKVNNIIIDPEKESELILEIRHRTYIVSLLEKLINEYISKSGVIARHKKIARKDKPCKCITCTGTEIVELERNIKGASQMKYLLEFEILEYINQEEKPNASNRKSKQISSGTNDYYSDDDYADSL